MGARVMRGWEGELVVRGGLTTHAELTMGAVRGRVCEPCGECMRSSPSGPVRSNISSQPVSTGAFPFSRRLSWRLRGHPSSAEASAPRQHSVLPCGSLKAFLAWVLRPWGHTDQEPLVQAPDMLSQSGGHCRWPWLPLLACARPIDRLG